MGRGKQGTDLVGNHERTTLEGLVGRIRVWLLAVVSCLLMVLRTCCNGPAVFHSAFARSYSAMFAERSCAVKDSHPESAYMLLKQQGVWLKRAGLCHTLLERKSAASRQFATSTSDFKKFNQSCFACRHRPKCLQVLRGPIQAWL